MIRNDTLSDWPERTTQLYAKHFNAKAKIERKQELDDVIPSTTASSGYDEDLNIREELIRQNNWMNSKLKSIMEKNTKLEKEKKDLYLKI
jgi:hypothetical protein